MLSSAAALLLAPQQWRLTPALHYYPALNNGVFPPLASQFNLFAPNMEPFLTLPTHFHRRLRTHRRLSTPTGVVSSPSALREGHQWKEKDGHLETTLFLRGFDTASLQAELEVNDQTLTIRGSKEAPGYKSSVSRALKLPSQVIQGEPAEIQLEHNELNGCVRIRVPIKRVPEPQQNPIPLAVKAVETTASMKNEAEKSQEKQIETSFADKFSFIHEKASADVKAPAAMDVVMVDAAQNTAADESTSPPKSVTPNLVKATLVPGMP